MTIAETIKQAREDLGLTQEDLAEKLEVSRQAVSKWELGASMPSPENLALLEEVLGVSFPAPEEETAQSSEQGPKSAVKAPFWNWKRVVLLILGVLVLLALISNVLFMTLIQGRNANAPVAPAPNDPYITDIAFFDKDAGSLRPDLGDGWNSFTAGERVLVVVTFEEGAENTVDAVSLFLTPTGTETLDQRKQLAVQAAGEGRDFALFAWDIPGEGLTGHLEVVLECGGGLRVMETLNVTAPSPLPDSPEIPGILSLSSSEINAVSGDTGHYILEAYGTPFAEVEWSSSNPGVARVANTGRVFIEGPGEAVITASWKDQTAECLVRVFPKAPVVGIEGHTDLPEGEPEGILESEPVPPTYESRKS